VQQKAKSLNCRAIRPHDAAAHTVPLVERNLDRPAICTRIARLDPLIFLRLQDGGPWHAKQGCGDKNAGDEQS
jgi:hypothetical protein